MPEIGLLPFARVALDVATTVLPTYRSRFSKHQFTQPQLLAILCFQQLRHSFCKTPGVAYPPSFSVSASTPCALRLGVILSLVFPRPSRTLSYLPLESTLIKVYQNKQLHLPLESTLVKNRGEGGLIVN